MRKSLFVEPFSGIAGDMFVGALLDAGADFETVRAAVAAIPAEGIEVRATKVMRGRSPARSSTSSCTGRRRCRLPRTPTPTNTVTTTTIPPITTTTITRTPTAVSPRCARS